MKIPTVNVIEYVDDSIISLHSFSDDLEGNKEAATLFIRIIQENGADECGVDLGIGEGYFEQGDYQAFITHSS